VVPPLDGAAVHRVGSASVPWWLPSSLDALRERPYRLLWLGRTASSAGDSLVPVALAFATIQVAHGSPSALGLVLGSSVAAQTVFLPLGGVWGDRLPRQVVMMTSDGVRAVVQAALAALLLSGHAQVWELIVGMVLQGASSAFFLPASTALVPQTVSAAGLQQANALIGMSRSATQVGAPVLSGVVVATVGPAWAFAANAATFLVSAATLAALRLPPVPRAPRRSTWHEFLTGWREVSHRQWYFLNLGTHACWNLGVAAFFVLGPVVASRVPGGAPAWGIISAAIAVGSLGGGLVALRLLPGRPLVAANLALTLGALVLVALALQLPVVVIVTCTVLCFAGVTFLNEIWSTVMQQLIPAEVMARVSSFDWTLSLVAMPVGYALSGIAATSIGVSGTLLLGALVLALPNALVVLVPGVRGIRRLPDGTIAQASPVPDPI
jgi:MFS family permease